MKSLLVVLVAAFTIAACAAPPEVGRQQSNVEEDPVTFLNKDEVNAFASSHSCEPGESYQDENEPGWSAGCAIVSPATTLAGLLDDECTDWGDDGACEAMDNTADLPDERYSNDYTGRWRSCTTTHNDSRAENCTRCCEVVVECAGTPPRCRYVIRCEPSVCFGDNFSP